MNEIDKLRVMLPHWIEHNREHAADYARWADTAAASGHPAAAAKIRAAIRTAEQTNADLEEALRELGGPLSPQEHGHEH